MGVRLATAGDLNRIADLGAYGCAAARLPRPFKRGNWLTFWATALKTGGFIVLRESDGGEVLAAMGGMVVPDGETATNIGGQFFLVTNPAKKGDALRLIPFFERECRRRGAEFVILRCPEHSKAPIMAAYCEKQGYSKLETDFLKDVSRV